MLNVNLAYKYDMKYHVLLSLNSKAVIKLSYVSVVGWLLTLKAPAKNSSENVICFRSLLYIFANITDQCMYRGKQCGP